MSSERLPLFKFSVAEENFRGGGVGRRRGVMDLISRDRNHQVNKIDVNDFLF